MKNEQIIDLLNEIHSLLAKSNISKEYYDQISILLIECKIQLRKKVKKFMSYQDTSKA